VRTRVSRWGHSLAIRIPAAFAQEARIEDGTAVELTVDRGQLVVAPVRPTYLLEDLVDQITDENLHDETAWGAPVGGEVW
jgi:antitoxin MazE